MQYSEESLFYLPMGIDASGKSAKSQRHREKMPAEVPNCPEVGTRKTAGSIHAQRSDFWQKRLCNRFAAWPRMGAYRGRSLITTFVAIVPLMLGCSDTTEKSQQSPLADKTVVANDHPPSQANPTTEDDSLVKRLVASEELILRLTPQLERLQRSVYNLRLPDHNSRPLFASRLTTTNADLERGDTPLAEIKPLRVTKWLLQPRGTESITTSDVSDGRLCPWLFEDLVCFDSAKFAIVDGQFVNGAGETFGRFRTGVRFNGTAHAVRGGRRAVSLDLSLDWVRDDDGQWRIVHWENWRCRVLARDEMMFADVRQQVIPNRLTRAQTRTSQHAQFALRHFYPRIRARLPGDYEDDRFFAISTAHHPGLAVVDVDQDGWDDLYITVRWGRNMLLRNQGDGTFRDVAAEHGLDIEGRSNAAVFADFDNDGDPDVMIARSLDRSLYLENVDGQFKDRSDKCAFPLPYAATSVSAADYNNDGLLDVYFSTYHQEDVSRRIDADLSHPEHRIHKTLSPQHSAELARRFRQQTRSYINQVGPPNILLVNLGSRFELAPQNPQVAIWCNSFQATWCDYDRDGDVDVYVANDFAPDVLLRNDGPGGFQDVTQASGIHLLGFGMGASWGDYNNDGRPDLYVSNMFSKAGRRITNQVDRAAKLDRRIVDLAQGNYLFRADAATLTLASQEPEAAAVARAGWSWGGQFADYDNDGKLDLYVASGYYSVPSEYETDVDL